MMFVVNVTNDGCSEKYLEIVIRTLQSIVPDSFHLDTFIREALEDFQDSSQKELKKQQADASAVNSGGNLFLFKRHLCVLLMSMVLYRVTTRNDPPRPFHPCQLVEHFLSVYSDLLHSLVCPALRTVLPSHA